MRENIMHITGYPPTLFSSIIICRLYRGCSSSSCCFTVKLSFTFVLSDFPGSYITFT